MSALVVLVVEDNVRMRALIRSLVEELTPTVFECGDGEAALVLYARHRPDWVLMDIKMDGMDGIAATRAILTSDPGAHVIIVTEQDEPSYREAATAAGACGFVRKDRLLDLPAMLTAR